MDIKRPASAARNKKIKRLIYLGLALIGASAVTFGLSRMRPPAPTVDGATLWRESVKRGPMLVTVRGLGTLVPEEVRLIPAARDGMVEEKRAKVGDTVKADTVLVVLRNADLLQQVADAELAYHGAQADLINTRAQLDKLIIDQKASQSEAESTAIQAKLQADADQQLLKEGLGAELPARLSVAKAQNAALQVELEKQRVDTAAKSADAQIGSQQARVDQLKAVWELRKKQADELSVRAGADGVLQQLTVEVGQHVAPGDVLAKVAQPGRLKAELKIPETQANVIILGQVASVDTRNGIIAGHVSRMDPAAINGTVTVDVKLEGELPVGARPDLSVDGTVEVSKLDNVLFVGRPAYGQANATITIFKMTPTGEAVRTTVKLGQASVNTIQILEGLNVGDKVILSDMSTWDAVDRVKVTN